jgi:hypothetical protein
VLHLNVDQAGWAGVEWEYADSIKQIEEKIPGHQVAHLAYPGGKNSGLNDRDLAAKYYASARGTTGKINPPNKIDYLGVFAMTAPNLGDGGKWADLNMLFQPGNAAYRGWAVLIYHYVKDKSTVEPYLAFFDEHRDNLWLGLYGDVARYGQQRDTATLTVTEKSGDRIVFDLTDRMDDQVFDYPLTIKIHLPPAWNGVSAMQKGAEISSRLVENGNAKFALVDAVPNQGEVTLEPR